MTFDITLIEGESVQQSQLKYECIITTKTHHKIQKYYQTMTLDVSLLQLTVLNIKLNEIIGQCY